MVPMMYETALKFQKLYRQLMSSCTAEVLNWSEGTQVLLGVPAHDDAGAGYHTSRVENLRNAIRGIHAGLRRFETLPENYAGKAIYCEWDMDDREWALLKREFQRLH